MTTQTLLEHAYSLLDSSDLTYREIAIGAAVDMNWLAKFKQRLIKEPGVGKVQRVYDFLATGKAIIVPSVDQHVA